MTPFLPGHSLLLAGEIAQRRRQFPLAVALYETVLRFQMAQTAVANPNVLAFLHAISGAENYGYGGYNSSAYSRIFGGGTAPNFLAFPTNTPKLHSPSGAYQITRGSYANYGSLIGLSDFMPNTQDLIGAYDFIHTGGEAALVGGNFAQAIFDASKEWSAVPSGSGSLDHRYAPPGSTPTTGAVPYQTFLNMYHAFGGTGGS